MIYEWMATTVGKIVVVALAVAAVFGAAYMVEKVWSDSISDARAAADKAGYDRASREFEERDNKALQAALGKVKQLEESERTAELRAAQSIADARVAHQKEIADANAKNTQLAAALRSGKRRLLDAEGRCAAGSAGGDGEKAAAANPAGSTGGAGCELSGRTAGNLSDLAARADRVRANIRLCQVTLAAYAEACKEQ